MLPLNARDTYDRLRHSFEQEYCNPNANIAERELFYARRQQYGETAMSYIEFMIKLGNKLQIDANEILRTARRGLLPDLYMYLLDKNIANIAELKQKVQLREMMHTIADTTQVNKVQFSSNTQAEVLQNSIDKLTGALDKLNLSSYSYSQQTRARSPSPYSTHRDDRVQHQQQQSLPFCTKCLCNGHVAHQCRITSSQLRYASNASHYRQQHFQSNQPNNYQSRFNAPYSNNVQQYRQNNYSPNPRYQSGNFSRNAYYGSRYNSHNNLN